MVASSRMTHTTSCTSQDGGCGAPVPVRGPWLVTPTQGSPPHSQVGLPQAPEAPTAPFLGLGTHKVLFVPSKHLWQV